MDLLWICNLRVIYEQATSTRSGQRFLSVPALWIAAGLPWARLLYTAARPGGYMRARVCVQCSMHSTNSDRLDRLLSCFLP